MALNYSPPRLTKPSYRMNHPTRWEREKAATSDPNAFEYPGDPKLIGPWIVGETVGKGASGRVKLARHKLTGKLAAVKILPAGIVARSRSSLAKAEKHRMGIEREIVMMKLMEHPNIMRLYDVWEGERELFLVLEWVEGGELFDLIVNRGRLPPLEALAYFKQIIHGLSYCHAFSIAHRDLKPENILIHGANNELIKIADWGMAAFQSPSAQLETSCGSPHYASPEIIRGDPYEGTKADIWSVGVVLFALVAGKLPFDDKHVPSLLNKVKSGKFEMPAYIFPEAADLIRKMLVVDTTKRITMTEILAHPYLSRDTPGIYYIPAPSVSALHTPLASADDINQDVLSSLRIIFGKHATRALITQELLQDGPNVAKAFYVLLIKFRDRQMENFNADREDADNKTGPHPYQSPRVQIIDHTSTASTSSPPSSIPLGSTRLKHTRTQSSPTKHRSAPVGMRPRLPTISGTRPPGMPQPLIPVPSYATATYKDSGGEGSEVAPPSAPVIPASPAPSYQSTVSLPRPNQKKRDTTPIIASLGLGISAPAAKLAIGVSIRSSRRRRDTSPSAVRPQTDAGMNVPTPEITSQTSHPAPTEVNAAPCSPVPRMRRATSPVPPPHVVPHSLPSQTSASPDTPPSTDAPTTAPGENSETQHPIDVLTSQLNVLGDRDSAPQQLQSIVRLQEMQAANEDGRDSRTSAVLRRSNHKPERSANLPAAKEKENARSPQRGRAGSEIVKRSPGTSKLPVANGYSEQARDRSGHPPITEEEKENDGVRSTKRGRAGSEGARMSQGGFKRGLTRKTRPTALDLDGPPTGILYRPTFNTTSPTSTPATPLLSPVVGEFRGWFSNLFNWKTPTYVLHSHNNFVTTRNETTRLLTEFGVSVLADNAQGWGILKCKVDEIMDVSGMVTQKQVRFRVEFTPYRAHLLASPAFEGPSRMLPPGPPQTNVPFSCTLTLVQEKGALSTFRAVYHRLRVEWRLDALHSPAVGSMFPMYGARPGGVMESGTGVMFLR